MERVIKIFSTNIRKVINSAAQTWGELQSQLRNEGVSYSNMKAISSVNKITFEHPDATLPEGEFTLYLTPQRTKSGSHVRELVDELIKIQTACNKLVHSLHDLDAKLSAISNDGEWQEQQDEYDKIMNEMNNHNLDEDDDYDEDDSF
jgi:hypothetical protein